MTLQWTVRPFVKNGSSRVFPLLGLLSGFILSIDKLKTFPLSLYHSFLRFTRVASSLRGYSLLTALLGVVPISIQFQQSDYKQLDNMPLNIIQA